MMSPVNLMLFMVMCNIMLLFPVEAFGPIGGNKLNARAFIQATRNYQRDSTALASSLEKPLFGESKLLPPLTQEEIEDLMREFNITTSVDIYQDPEVSQWQLSKDFFEKFGFLNRTQIRTVQDVKTQFYSNYRVPILPQYKTFIADLLYVVYVQSVDARFVPDALHAFGICTQYYTIMKGYGLQDEIDVIFNEMMTAMGLDPVKLREDAKRILTLIKESPVSGDDFLTLQEGEIAEIFNNVRRNRFFKYTDAWGVGLGRLMELKGIDPNLETFTKWGESLRWLSGSRMMMTWTEFCSDQLKMQGVEAMQKQILIREKKRAAERLEKKAASFQDRKKALQILNEALLEKKREIIEIRKNIVKKADPDLYEQISAKQAAKAAAATGNALPPASDGDIAIPVSIPESAPVNL